MQTLLWKSFLVAGLALGVRVGSGWWIANGPALQ
jgi:hypothetical protein